MNDDLEDSDKRGSKPTSAGKGPDTRRRKLLTAGALIVPAIVTLHATPAWAQTDYTMTAYRYGTNQGMCRNPDSASDEEFIPCGQGEGSSHEEVEYGQEPGPGPDGF
jgi:hypothetical protein